MTVTIVHKCSIQGYVQTDVGAALSFMSTRPLYWHPRGAKQRALEKINPGSHSRNADTGSSFNYSADRPGQFCNGLICIDFKGNYCVIAVHLLQPDRVSEILRSGKHHMPSHNFITHTHTSFNILNHIHLAVLYIWYCTYIAIYATSHMYLYLTH